MFFYWMGGSRNAQLSIVNATLFTVDIVKFMAFGDLRTGIGLISTSPIYSARSFFGWAAACCIAQVTIMNATLWPTDKIKFMLLTS